MSKREYRSNVFSMLLEESDNALSVYNALNGTSYDDAKMVKIMRLESGIVLTIRNDASFIIDNSFSLYEHQSTYNPNMPLRSLIYFADIIKRLVKKEDLYSRKKVMIPTPQFAVFYNGSEERSGIETLKLSDSFIKDAKENSMELVCTVYNINRGKNDSLLSRCPVLDEYVIFTDKIKDTIVKYTDDGFMMNEALDRAIDEAIKECIEEDVLKDFLIRRGNEVREMAALDYTWERREKLIARDSRAEGKAIGLSIGEAIGLSKGRKEGEIIGEIKAMYKRFNMSAEDISKELELDIDYVNSVIATL